LHLPGIEPQLLSPEPVILFLEVLLLIVRICLWVFTHCGYFFFSIKFWADELGDELWHLGQSITKATDMKAVSNRILRSNTCLQLCND
jgi:hypothetical protein